MIAYHFPPLAGSSGIQRTLRFVQHLPSLGWQPMVLTAHVRAYETTSQDLLADVPADTIVRRAFALDTARHLQLAGRYLGWMARPDRWISWKLDGVREGMRMIEQFHRDAAKLHQKTRIPWVADFRDPIGQDSYPTDPLTRQSYLQIQEQAAQLASFCSFAKLLNTLVAQQAPQVPRAEAA